MNRFFLSILALSAIVIGVEQASAGAKQNSMNNANNDGAIIIEESYTSSSVAVPNNAYNSQTNDMQPLPNNPGVEVAPVPNADDMQPVMVEEDVLIQQTEDGE